MNVILEGLAIRRGSATVAARAVMGKGLHLIRGPVGCGKSTLALAMAGLWKPEAGSVVRDGIGSFILSLQFPEYHVTGTTLTDECASWGIDPVPVLAAEGLADRSGDNPLSLSRGELKRLHLACVMAKPCDLLILDEPFSALDCGQKERLCSKLSGRTEGITLVFTHEEEILPAAVS